MKLTSPGTGGTPTDLSERIAGSNALYHDRHHTTMVALVGQDILRGVRLEKRVTARDWFHFLIAALSQKFQFLSALLEQQHAKRRPRLFDREFFRLGEGHQLRHPIRSLLPFDSPGRLQHSLR